MPPLNDNFEDRTVLTGTTFSVTGNNTSATLETGETYYDTEGYDCDNSVWFEWVATANGILTIDTEGSIDLTDTMLWLFTGTTVDGLTLLDYDDDGGTGALSYIQYEVTSGISYKIAVTGYDESSVGEFYLNGTFDAFPVARRSDFESLCVIPSDSFDEVWVVVNRENGRTIERMAVRNDYYNCVDGAAHLILESFFHVDSGVVYGENQIIVEKVQGETPILITANNHGFSNNDVVRFSNLFLDDEFLMETLNNKTFIVREATTNTFVVIP